MSLTTVTEPPAARSVLLLQSEDSDSYVVIFRSIPILSQKNYSSVLSVSSVCYVTATKSVFSVRCRERRVTTHSLWLISVSSSSVWFVAGVGWGESFGDNINEYSVLGA